MIAAITQSLSMDKLPVNWFDGALLFILGFGLFRGRKNGMTKEVIPTIQWIVLVAGAGFGYSFLENIYHTNCHLSNLASALLGYFSIALVTFLVFSGIKKVLMPRLTGSNIFGGSEYYLGMPSGMIRYGCILLFFMALLHARHYTSAEIAAREAYVKRWYGGGIYSGNYIPDLHDVQDAVFRKSLTGPYISDYFGTLLIQTGPGDTGGPGKSARPQAVIHIGN